MVPDTDMQFVPEIDAVLQDKQEEGEDKFSQQEKILKLRNGWKEQNTIFTPCNQKILVQAVPWTHNTVIVVEEIRNDV